MKKNFLFIKIIFIYVLLAFSVNAKESVYLVEGINLFNKKEFDKSKVLFERDLVFDPKSEKSYLYLAKIFNQKNNETEEDFNLNNVLLLNPQNDEAIYLLTLLKIKQSDYKVAKDLIERFSLVCKDFCFKKKEIEEKLKKIIPENAEKKN